jgi:membrane-bound metal-dependent hydrolase YbcI (DUF457 family)
MPDPITHLTAGYLFSSAFFRSYIKLFLILSLFPDVDGIAALVYLMFIGSPDYTRADYIRIFEQFHPTFTHSLLFIPLLALLTALVLKRFKAFKKDNFSKLSLIALLAFLVHFSVDMLQTGNKPFWPLETEMGLGLIPYGLTARIVTVSISLTLFAACFLFRKKKILCCKKEK